ncbi:serine/threonine-protein phosphatase, partial [Streptomyces yanii]
MEDSERRPGKNVLDRSEGLGERLLGLLLDRAHEMPPQLIAPMIAEEVAGIDGREVSILLQDYGRELLVPLPGQKLIVGEPQEITASPA